MTQQQLSQIQNRFSQRASAKIESIQLSSEQKAIKTSLDKEFSEFLLEMKDEREVYNKILGATISSATVTCREGNQEVSKKIKISRKLLVDDYVRAGISKEHVPFTEQGLAIADKAATKAISKTADTILGAKEWFDRKKEGQLG